MPHVHDVMTPKRNNHPQVSELTKIFLRVPVTSVSSEIPISTAEHIIILMKMTPSVENALSFKNRIRKIYKTVLKKCSILTVFFSMFCQF